VKLYASSRAACLFRQDTNIGQTDRNYINVVSMLTRVKNVSNFARYFQKVSQRWR